MATAPLPNPNGPTTAEAAARSPVSASAQLSNATNRKVPGANPCTVAGLLPLQPASAAAATANATPTTTRTRGRLLMPPLTHAPRARFPETSPDLCGHVAEIRWYGSAEVAGD
jgi:hypothetical protein